MPPISGSEAAVDCVIGPVAEGRSPAVKGEPLQPGSAAVTAAAASPKVSLAEFIGTRAGRGLSRRDQTLVAEVEAVFQRSGGTVTEPELYQLGGHAGYFYGWGSHRVTLWPPHRPPRSAIEAWLYVAHALRARKKVPPTGIYQCVPWDAVDRLMTTWLREQEIAHWEQELKGLSLHSHRPPVPAVFRLRLSPEGGQIEWRPPGAAGFAPIKAMPLRQHALAVLRGDGRCDHPLDASAQRFLAALCTDREPQPFLKAGTTDFETGLDRLLRMPGFEEAVVSSQGRPLTREPEPLRWVLEGPVFSERDTVLLEQEGEGSGLAGDYEASLRSADGREMPPPLAVLRGWPALYVTPDQVCEMHGGLGAPTASVSPIRIPAAALETEAGVAAMDKMGVALPERVARRVVTQPLQVTVRCRLHTPSPSSVEFFQVNARSTSPGRALDEQWSGQDWFALSLPSAPPAAHHSRETSLIRLDRSLQTKASAWLAGADVKMTAFHQASTVWLERRLQGAALREFPTAFLDWLDRRPEGVAVELDPELASLREGRVSGSVRLDAEEAGVDWFDLRVSLDVSEVELTQVEIDALLKAQGRWVRLPDKGWRRLDFNLSDEDQAQLADLGLGVGDLASGEKQRFHVLQLAGATATRMLPAERVEQVQRRAAELRTEVTPEVPAAITASLRPYQREGYHFLAYLSANRFGGILADDMGLGKTVQTLSWLAWLRETGQLDGPVLVVCPKSVQDNWRAEVARFCPGLGVRVWSRESAGVFAGPAPAEPAGSSRKKKPAAPAPTDDLLIINYTQLRLHEEALLAKKWSAVVLDEAQYIKNPSSQTAKAACALPAGHRLALSGTPIENRLLDLWSIMNFAMPGVLGNRTAFARNFNGKDDPLARRRLSARVRPFVLRRTKKEVAKDLPDRIEEEIICELEGPQAMLYRAELKRARATLLKAKTSTQLDKLRFNILTSLLRLRQICCHPALVGAGQPGDESAKLAALLDLLEPLVEEGHKVLVFSQFVEMLELIRGELAQREWPHLLLTGQTEDRGALVDTFQQTEGASVFLISLKAGGFGLNLTAASYVVLFDPWWNPAVENQAIDRTHRIGQVNKVIAYRLLVRETIEEKIRQLQKQKNALASDILGEEGFAKALTLDDFRFLLGGGEDGAAA